VRGGYEPRPKFPSVTEHVSAARYSLPPRGGGLGWGGRPDSELRLGVFSRRRTREWSSSNPTPRSAMGGASWQDAPHPNPPPQGGREQNPAHRGHVLCLHEPLHRCRKDHRYSIHRITSVSLLTSRDREGAGVGERGRERGPLGPAPLRSRLASLGRIRWLFVLRSRRGKLAGVSPPTLADGGGRLSRRAAGSRRSPGRRGVRWERPDAGRKTREPGASLRVVYLI